MPNQRRPGSRKITVNLDQSDFLVLETYQKAHNLANPTQALKQAALQGAGTQDPVLAPKEAPVLAPNSKHVDAQTAIKRLEQDWGFGGFFVVQQLILAHKPEVLAWLTNPKVT